MPKIALKVAYDGTAYRGWTHVRDAALRPTVQRVAQCAAVIVAASRTDAGVHA